MHDNRAFQEEGSDSLQSGFFSLSSHIGYYPQSVFSTLVWLRREREALALAELAEESISHVQALCTIAEHLRKRGDGEKQQILSILAQTQKCLASLQTQRTDLTVDRLQADLVVELVAWQKWQPAQELAHTISGSWKREEAFGSIFLEMLQAGMWEEARAVAWSAGDAGHWMLYDLCAVLAKMQAWERAEEIARSIEPVWNKVRALSTLARGLAIKAEVAHAKLLWKQAIQAVYEGGELSVMVLSAVSEDLARAQQWELAESVARAITFPLPWAKNRPKWQGNILDQQTHDEDSALWTLVERSKALARLASEYSKVQYWEHAEAIWEEARVVAKACKRIWYYTLALSNLTLCFAEANLWELALNTWGQVEAIWQEAQALSQNITQQEKVDSFHSNEDEKEERRLKVLVPLCQHLVDAQQWKQAWKLFCELEDTPIKIRLGREIAAALDRTQQSEDAQMVWRHTSELALATQLQAHDLAELALALQQARYWNEADTIWKASVKSMLEEDEDDPGCRTINCGSLALELAQAQRWEEAELLLKESVRVAALLASADLQQVN